jgi:hypothetical protein
LAKNFSNIAATRVPKVTAGDIFCYLVSFVGFLQHRGEERGEAISYKYVFSDTIYHKNVVVFSLHLVCVTVSSAAMVLPMAFPAHWVSRQCVAFSISNQTTSGG